MFLIVNFQSGNCHIAGMFVYLISITNKPLYLLYQACSTPNEQVHKLLELLPKRGPAALDKFITVIEKDYPWLATAMLTSGVVKQAGGETTGRQNQMVKRKFLLLLETVCFCADRQVDESDMHV